MQFTRGGAIRTLTPSSKKQTLVGLFSLLVVFSLVFGDVVIHSTPVAFAATLQELTKQKSALQQQIEKAQQEAAAKKKAAEAEAARQAQLNNAVNKIEKDISATENKIGETEDLIGDVASAIAELQNSVKTKESDIGRKKEDLYETAVEYHIAMSGGVGIDSILTSSRLSQAIDESANFNSLADKLIIDGETLDKEKQDLIAKKAEMEEKQQKLKGQKDQLAAYQSALDGQRQQKEELIGSSKEAQEKFLTQADEAKKVSENLKKQFAAVSNEEAAMRRAASTRILTAAPKGGAVSGGGFMWPVEGIITTRFSGSTPFQSYHTGIDLAGPAGDPIVATNGGTITRVEQQSSQGGSKPCGTTDYDSYGYGNWVEIRQDNGYKSRYAHLMKCSVSVGQRVERGQVVGYRGGSVNMAGAGWSTGAHLHFEIWDGQGPFDPLIVLP
jgi:murein DD-endopeptidase MepM/ murein hydrolase activator NlpD